MRTEVGLAAVTLNQISSEVIGKSVGGAGLMMHRTSSIMKNTLMLIRIMISETAVHSRMDIWLRLCSGFIIKLRTYIPITVRQGEIVLVKMHENNFGMEALVSVLNTM